MDGNTTFIIDWNIIQRIHTPQRGALGPKTVDKLVYVACNTAFLKKQILEELGINDCSTDEFLLEELGIKNCSRLFFNNGSNSRTGFKFNG